MAMTILFDLDGTLTDPKTGITKSVRYALHSFGIEVQNLDELTKFIGPPLKDSFEKYYGFSASDTEKAIAKYREYFSDRGIFENEVYAGIPEMLKALQHKGATLVVATSKPAVYARRILEYFALAGFFSFVAGSELDGTRNAKREVISYALEKLGISDGADVIMVGDREHDIIGANENGIASVGVAYGYGSREELSNAGAVYMVESVAELTQLLLKQD